MVLFLVPFQFQACFCKQVLGFFDIGFKLFTLDFAVGVALI